MGKKVQLTFAEGNRLLMDCFQLVIPDKIEDIGSWNKNIRNTVTQNLRQLKKALCAVSPLWQEEKVPKFGPKDAYEKIVREVGPAKKEREADEVGEVIKHNYVVKDSRKNDLTEVELNGQAEKGAQIVCLLRTYPGRCYLQNDNAFNQSLSAGFQDEQIWPLAEKLGINKDLHKKLGLDSPTNLEFKSNDDIESEKGEVIPFEAPKKEPVEA